MKDPNDILPKPETTDRQQDGRFRPGKSGNPAGRPIGARHRSTVMVENLLAGEAEAVARTVVQAAIDGDMVAARLVLERVCPPTKGRFVKIDLPAISDGATLTTALRKVVASLAAAEITTDEATEIAKVIELIGGSLERRELEERIDALEKQR